MDVKSIRKMLIVYLKFTILKARKYYPNPKKVQHMLEIRTLQHQWETLPSPRNMW